MITIACKGIDEKAPKGHVKRLRRAGEAPYIVYSKGETRGRGVIQKADFEAILRSLKSGFLTTTKFLLVDEKGNKIEAVIKEVQYKPTNYELLHIDFLQLEKDVPLNIKVPVDIINSVDCVGVKHGGTLRSVLRHIKVKCLPDQIPTQFEVDVKDLEMHQSKRVNSISIPEGVRCLSKENEVVVSIVKR